LKQPKLKCKLKKRGSLTFDTDSTNLLLLYLKMQVYLKVKKLITGTVTVLSASVLIKIATINFQFYACYLQTFRKW